MLFVSWYTKKIFLKRILDDMTADSKAKCQFLLTFLVLQQLLDKVDIELILCIDIGRNITIAMMIKFIKSFN